jgi:hypothetical protein
LGLYQFDRIQHFIRDLQASQVGPPNFAALLDKHVWVHLFDEWAQTSPQREKTGN